MIRPGTIVWFCLVVAVGYAMFQVKYEVMQQEQTLAGINKQITVDREQIRVLDAEWTYLTRPARLQQLSDRFLHLQGMSSAQIIDLSAVPTRDNASTPLIADVPAVAAASPAATTAPLAAEPVAVKPVAAVPAAAPVAAAPVAAASRPQQSASISSEELAAQIMSPRIVSALQKPIP
jgi:hypothetical protein